MSEFKEDWVEGNLGHDSEHNLISRVLNGSLDLTRYGAIPDLNTATARTANNAAFASALSDAKRTDTTYHESGGVYIAPGDYYIDQPITIQDHWGLKLYSHGRGARIMWRGGNDAAIKIFNSRECLISNLIISGEGTGYGVQLARVAGATIIQHHNTLEQVEIENFTDCVLIGGVNSIDANNDFHEFIHCTFRDYQLYAVQIPAASQSYGNHFINCMAWAAANTGQAAVKTGNAGGSFIWDGGGAAGNIDADFILGRHYQPHVIRGVVSENSARFVRCETDVYLNVLIESCRWNANNLHADHEAIKIDNVQIAQLSIRNSKIGDGQTPTVGTLINFAPVNADATLSGFEFVNNWVVSSAQDVFNGRDPTLKSGNVQLTDEVNLTFAAL